MTSSIILVKSNTPEGRRILLKRAKVATADIATAACVTTNTVRSVISGFGRSSYVEAAIAEALNLPCSQLFSPVEHTRARRKSEPRYPEGRETLGGGK